MERKPLIGAEGTEPLGAERRSGAAGARDDDECLDAALACTFPASDPISCLRSEVPTNRTMRNDGTGTAPDSAKRLRDS